MSCVRRNREQYVFYVGTLRGKGSAYKNDDEEREKVRNNVSQQTAGNERVRYSVTCAKL
jgi:hypothetical protein